MTKMPYGYWNNETNIKEAALKCSTRKEFFRLYPAAYNKSKSLGIYEDVVKHMHNSPKQNTWDKNSIIKAISKCSTINDIHKNYPGLYKAAVGLGIYEEVIAHLIPVCMKRNINDVTKLARKYTSRSEFKKGNKGAYEWARRTKNIDNVCKHMEVRKSKYNKSNLLKIFKKYTNKVDLRANNEAAYIAARRLGVFNEVSSHFINDYKSSDMIYLWQVSGTDICKIGITSKRLGIRRIDKVAKTHGVNPIIHILIEVNHAYKLETKLHKLFTTPQNLIVSGDGYSEFKTMSQREINKCINLILHEATQ